MSRYNIGIDTGGTYTDAVIVDLQDRQILASAKALTTHGDLSIGVANSLRKVLEQVGADFPRAAVPLVAVSTTLATNALVEGQGGSVTAILIGFDDAMTERTRIAEAVPGARIVQIRGGHDHAGEEQHALDEDALRATVIKYAPSTDAFAIASLYSVRNHSHETRAAEIVRENCTAPVTISSDLSNTLHGPRRALTASLNARIISRIVALIAAVKQSLQNEGIDAKLMIVKGDGSLASDAVVAERPIETILSGPAASVIGARYLTNQDSFIVSDIGGTTTDIAIAHNGWPDVSESGSIVGDYSTLVRAIDMQTVGLGGDSEVLVDYDGSIELSGNRVVPVSLLGSRWPSVDKFLQSVLNGNRGYRNACRFLLLPEGRQSAATADDLEPRDRDFLEQIKVEPVPWNELVHRTADEQSVKILISRGLIQTSGFTPSDAAHVLGSQSQWSITTARLGCKILGKACRRLPRNQADPESGLDDFAGAIRDVVVQKSTYLILQRLAGQSLSGSDTFVDAITAGTSRVGELNVALQPSVPLVAVGGPAALYYPEVGRRLGTEAIIPEFAAVANAIGAAVGMIKVHASIEITAVEDSGFTVHADTPVTNLSASSALKQAAEILTEQVEAQARTMGAISVKTELSTDRIDLPDSDGDHGLIAATITADCTGIPD